MPSLGGKPRVGNMNGVDMGIGSGPTQVPGPVSYTHLDVYKRQNTQPSGKGNCTRDEQTLRSRPQEDAEEFLCWPWAQPVSYTHLVHLRVV